MNDLLFDLETIPCPNHPPPPPKPGKEATFPAPAHHRIVSIACCQLDDDGIPIRLGCIGDPKDSERKLLGDFWEYVLTAPNNIRLVTHNGRGFDLPVAVTRAFMYGIQIPGWLNDPENGKRYSDRGHVDIQEWFSNFGAVRPCQAGELAKLVGFPGKIEDDDGTMIDGSRVEGMIRDGRIDDVRTYNLCDTADMTAVYLRVRWMRMIPSAFATNWFQRAGTVLLDEIRRNRNLGKYLAMIDRDRFLMQKDYA